MERTEILDIMAELKLYGMKAAYRETLATTPKRQHEPQRLVGDLLPALHHRPQTLTMRFEPERGCPCSSPRAA